MCLIPLSEGCTINCNNGILYKGLCTDHFIVASIVYNINDTGLASQTFTSPGKVTSVKAKSPVFLVSTPGTDSVDTLRSKLCIGSRTSKLELPLLAGLNPFATSSP